MEQRKMSEEKKAKSEWVHFRELRAVPRLQEGCPCCVQERNVFFVHDAYDPFARHNGSGDHRASI